MSFADYADEEKEIIFIHDQLLERFEELSNEKQFKGNNTSVFMSINPNRFEMFNSGSYNDFMLYLGIGDIETDASSSFDSFSLNEIIGIRNHLDKIIKLSKDCGLL